MSAPLRDCESEVTDGSAVQWRQVHPGFYKAPAAGASRIVTLEAFTGVDGDRDRVSVSQEAIVSAEAATRFHRSLGLKTEGSWSVLVSDVVAVGARVVDDSACEDQDTPGHAYIDMRGWAKADKKAARTELARIATERGQASS